MVAKKTTVSLSLCFAVAVFWLRTGAPRDSMTKEQCCGLCWANKACAVAVFSGAKAHGRCNKAPGSRCCWLKTKQELNEPGNDPGTVSCMPQRQ